MTEVLTQIITTYIDAHPFASLTMVLKEVQSQLRLTAEEITAMKPEIKECAKKIASNPLKPLIPVKLTTTKKRPAPTSGAKEEKKEEEKRPKKQKTTTEEKPVDINTMKFTNELDQDIIHTFIYQKNKPMNELELCKLMFEIPARSRYVEPGIKRLQRRKVLVRSATDKTRWQLVLPDSVTFEAEQVRTA